MVSKILLALSHAVSSVLPTNRCFALRAAAFRAAGLSIGPGARIAGGVRFHGTSVSVGAGARINYGVHFFPGPTTSIKVGDNCDIAPRVTVNCLTHDVGGSGRRAGELREQSISIGDGSWIGVASTLTAGAGVDSGSLVAAGSLVRTEFPANSLIAGVPAAVRKELPA